MRAWSDAFTYLPPGWLEEDSWHRTWADALGEGTGVIAHCTTTYSLSMFCSSPCYCLIITL